MSEELKPCPFCGSDAKVYGTDAMFFAACTSPSCWCSLGEVWDSHAMPAHIFESEAEAIAAWNNRAQSVSAPIQQADEYAQLLKDRGGWKDEAGVLLQRNAALLRHIDMLKAHQSGDVWHWQGDGTDHLESMSNRMAVVIRADQLRTLQASTISAASVPPFTVSVAEMTESHRKTYWVQLINNATRPAGAKPWDNEGYITPYFSEHKDRAEQTAQEWAEFLGVEFAAAPIQDAAPQEAK